MKNLFSKNLLAKISLDKNLFHKNLFNKDRFNKDLFSKDRFARLNKDTFGRWLPAATQTRTRKVALAAAGLAVTGGAIAGPVLATGSDAQPSPAAGQPAVASVSTGGPAAASPAAEKAKEISSQPADKQVNIAYQPQSTYYYCGPAATQIAASAQGHNLSQDNIAGKLGTTVNGTNSAADTTRVLNNIVGASAYHTTSVSGTPNQAQVDKVQADVMRSLNNGRAVVANIAGTTTDTAGGTHDFGGGHYLTVIGYNDHGNNVRISDPADVNGASDYWISASNLTHWMATRGYSS